MLNVGLTGGIGSGKSSVASVLEQRGARIVDFDKIAHEIQSPLTPVWGKIVETFGDNILNADNTINRQLLGEEVFGDRDKLKNLCAIVHPAIIERWQETASALANQHHNAIIIADVPLLFETRLQRLFDVTVFVYCPQCAQIERVMARNDLCHEAVLSRIEAQLPIKEKAKMADLLIDNSGDFAQTLTNIDEVWEKLVRMENTRRKKYD